MIQQVQNINTAMCFLCLHCQFCTIFTCQMWFHSNDVMFKFSVFCQFLHARKNCEKTGSMHNDHDDLVGKHKENQSAALLFWCVRPQVHVNYVQARCSGLLNVSLALPLTHSCYVHLFYHVINRLKLNLFVLKICLFVPEFVGTYNTEWHQNQGHQTCRFSSTCQFRGCILSSAGLYDVSLRRHQNFWAIALPWQ